MHILLIAAGGRPVHAADLESVAADQQQNHYRVSRGQTLLHKPPLLAAPNILRPAKTMCPYSLLPDAAPYSGPLS